MPDDQNTTQNLISEENSMPPSPQEPTEQGTENTAHSEPSVAPPEAPESSPSDFSVKSNDIPPSDSTHIEPEKELENQAENEPNPEPISEPEEAPEPETAQIPVNEPLKEPETLKTNRRSLFVKALKISCPRTSNHSSKRNPIPKAKETRSSDVYVLETI